MPVADCCKLMQELFAFVFLQRVTLISSHLSAPAFKKTHTVVSSHFCYLLKIHVHLILHEMLRKCFVFFFFSFCSGLTRGTCSVEASVCVNSIGCQWGQTCGCLLNVNLLETAFLYFSRNSEFKLYKTKQKNCITLNL